ncbi:molecular chaperone [soil metagenome]
MAKTLNRILAASAAVLMLSTAQATTAASFRVAPVTVDLRKDAKSATLTLFNDGADPITIQVRPFKWVQAGKGDELVPTDDIVASPPFTTLQPGATYVVRLVRKAGAVAASEESYRLLIDEIPDASRRRDGQVMLTLRQSIPVFFSSPSAPPASVAWRLQKTDAGFDLVGRNSGARRLRLSDLVISDASGKPITRRSGLFGYVLAGSERRWALDLGSSKLEKLRLSMQSDLGPIDVPVSISD